MQTRDLPHTDLVTRLSVEEIRELDVSAALRLLGEITNLNHDVTQSLIDSNEEMQMAKLKVDSCKNTLRLLKANASILQTIVRGA